MTTEPARLAEILVDLGEISPRRDGILMSL